MRLQAKTIVAKKTGEMDETTGDLKAIQEIIQQAKSFEKNFGLLPDMSLELKNLKEEKFIDFVLPFANVIQKIPGLSLRIHDKDPFEHTDLGNDKRIRVDNPREEDLENILKDTQWNGYSIKLSYKKVTFLAMRYNRLTQLFLLDEK